MASFHTAYIVVLWEKRKIECGGVTPGATLKLKSVPEGGAFIHHPLWSDYSQLYFIARDERGLGDSPEGEKDSSVQPCARFMAALCGLVASLINTTILQTR